MKTLHPVVTKETFFDGILQPLCQVISNALLFSVDLTGRITCLNQSSPIMEGSPSRGLPSSPSIYKALHYLNKVQSLIPTVNRGTFRLKHDYLHFTSCCQFVPKTEHRLVGLFILISDVAPINFHYDYRVNFTRKYDLVICFCFSLKL